MNVIVIYFRIWKNKIELSKIIYKNLGIKFCKIKDFKNNK